MKLVNTYSKPLILFSTTLLYAEETRLAVGQTSRSLPLVVLFAPKIVDYVSRGVLTPVLDSDESEYVAKVLSAKVPVRAMPPPKPPRPAPPKPVQRPEKRLTIEAIPLQSDRKEKPAVKATPTVNTANARYIENAD